MKLKTRFYTALYFIWKFFHKAWYFRKYAKFSGFNKKLQQAITDQEVDRIILKHQITKYMRKYLKVDARSKYIPYDHKSREQSRQQVIGCFGERMEALGITINSELELCTV
jgi:hypothetical protein